MVIQVISGESGCGKTRVIEKICRDLTHLYTPTPSKVLILYQRHQKIYDQIAAKYPYVSTAEGLNMHAIEAQKNNNNPNGTLLIIDDQMSIVTSNKNVETLVTSGRHWNLSGCVIVLHNLFPPGKSA